jgi:hypothetical protein
MSQIPCFTLNVWIKWFYFIYYFLFCNKYTLKDLPSVLLDLLYRMSVNDWYTFGNKIQWNYKAYPHITGISRKSNSQKFQNWRYISILPIFTARLRNFQKWRLPQRSAFAWLSIWKQIHAPVFSRPTENSSYGSTSLGIDTEVVWQLWNPGMHL